jgi:DNA-binding winged helix-turn-helix (wHTH) protein/Tfp pilus assembly protein PilF
MAAPMLRLGSFRFDPTALTLQRAGKTVRASRKTMELLAVLARAEGSVVPKEALRDALWPEGFIEDGNLTQQVYLLRHALAADPGVRVETSPRRGYRLVAPPTESFARFGYRQSRWIPRWAAVAAAVFVLASNAGAALHMSRAALPIEAERAYQLGRLEWEHRDGASLKRAERFFNETVRLARGDARGYAGLALVEVIRGDYSDDKTYMRAAFRRADAYAHAALARDWHSADAYDVLALIAEMEPNGKTRADALFQRAVALDPTNAYAHIWRGIVMVDQDRLDEARREFILGERLDPISKTAARWLGSVEYDRRAFDAAAEQFRSALILDPRDTDAALSLAFIDEARGDYRGALMRLKRFGSVIPRESRAMVAARLIALLGRRDEARRQFAALRWSKHVDPLEIAATQLALGDRRAALETLRRQPAEKRDHVNKRLKWDVRFDALRRLALETDKAGRVN